MKSHKHLFPQICAVDNVLAATRAAMQGKMGEASAARFHTRWETHAVQLAEELAAGTWQPGRYTYFATHEDGRRMEWGEDLFDVRVRRHGLPIGNLTSQFFANIHLDGFDHFAKQELGVKGYVRYVDDFLIENNLRSSNRNDNDPSNENNNVGFRVARPLRAKPSHRPDHGGGGSSAMPCRVQGPAGCRERRVVRSGGRIGNAPEAAGSGSEGRLRCHSARAVDGGWETAGGLGAACGDRDFPDLPGSGDEIPGRVRGAVLLPEQGNYI